MNPENIIKEAMQDVIQELLITDDSGKTHLVYITKIDYTDKGLEISFNSLSEVTPLLTELVQQAVYLQLEAAKPTLWKRIKQRAKDYFIKSAI